MTQGRLQTKQAPRWLHWVAPGAVAAALLLAGCGATAASTRSGAPLNAAQHAPASYNGSSSAPYATPPSSSSTSNTAQAQEPQFTIKALQASYGVDDPRQTANDMRQWILTTDPRAQTVGIDYSRQDDGQYDVQLTFSVQAALYPQVENYLANYTQSHGGRLVTLHETVQDVTSQFVDLQSRLTTLKTEQQRLLDLVSHAGDLNSLLTIDQRLTDVEGQIEQIEGQQNQLAGQTTFYNVSLSLQPANAVIAGPHPTRWNPGTVLGAAWSAALAFGEALANIIIWLAVFAIYVLPVLLVVWLARRWLRRRAARAAGAS
ncbi:MAG TPA: DUF4349 domain-containing protein [Ktedonobacterales bacterium]|nr:DUF4349 domain-containing protein [Ktedonobacterales bacterium]